LGWPAIRIRRRRDIGIVWADAIHPDFFSQISANPEAATIQNIDPREAK